MLSGLIKYYLENGDLFLSLSRLDTYKGIEMHRKISLAEANNQRFPHSSTYSSILSSIHPVIHLIKLAECLQGTKPSLALGIHRWGWEDWQVTGDHYTMWCTLRVPWEPEERRLSQGQKSTDALKKEALEFKTEDWRGLSFAVLPFISTHVLPGLVSSRIFTKLSCAPTRGENCNVPGMGSSAQEHYLMLLRNQNT